MKISNIIVHYNTVEMLNNCLDSIIEWGPEHDIEHIIVDNASHTDISDIVASYGPTITLISNDRNYGWAKAANIGISSSSSEYVLFMTPGTLVTEGLIQALNNFLDTNPQAGGVGPSQINEHGTPQPIHTKTTVIRELWAWQKIRKYFPTHAGYPGDKIIKGLNEIEVSCLSGFCFMTRRSALDQAGYFDEWPFMFGEEIDLSLRLNQLGWKCYVLLNYSAIHYQGSSYKPNQSLRRWVENCRLASRYYWKRKHYGYIYGFLEPLVGSINFLTRAIYNLCLVPISSRQNRFRLVVEDFRCFSTSIKLVILGQRYANKIMEVARYQGNISTGS